MINFTADIESYFSKLKSTLDNMDRNEINTLINLLIQARDEGRKIFIMGNGGSASTASHSVCDFNKGLSYGKDRRFKMICLNDDVNVGDFEKQKKEIQRSFEVIFPEKSSFEM